MKKTKIIQINTSSSSFAVEDYEKDIYRGWYAQTGFEIKKAKPKANIECWGIERKFKQEKVKDINGIKFRTFPSTISVRHGIEISMAMLKAMLKEQKKYDLILHFHEYHSLQAYLLLFFANKNKTRIIAQHHGGRAPIENLKKYKRLFLSFPIITLMQFAENLVFKKIDVFYFLSNQEEKYVKNLAPKSKLRFQTMGIGQDYFKKGNKEKARKKLGLDKNGKYVLFIGRIKSTKGIKELLDSAKELENIKFILIGQGQDSKKYIEYNKDNSIRNVKFLGQRFGQEKIDYLDACDCLILPSHTEGAPVVLMEAIAKNLPVIATKVGGIPKMIKNQKEGLLINVKAKQEIIDSIKEVLSWKESKKKSIKKSGEKYKWGEIVKNTLKDYGIL